MRRVDLVADGSLAGDAAQTGFPSVDRWLGGGVRAGDVVVLAGDIGSGKSALALAMAIRMAQSGTRVAFLSGEMSVERVMERALAAVMEVTAPHLDRHARSELSRVVDGLRRASVALPGPASGP